MTSRLRPKHRQVVLLLIAWIIMLSGGLRGAEPSTLGPGIPPQGATPPVPEGRDQLFPPPTVTAAAPEESTKFELSEYLRLDGQFRVRYEFADPFSYTADGVHQDDDAVFMRTRLGMLITPHPKLTLRLQIQDSRIWGEEGADADPPSAEQPPTGTNPGGSVTTSEDNLDIHQAYVDFHDLFDKYIGPKALSFRVGRQELSYGDQRLVSPLDWSNVGRAWDAALLRIAPPKVSGDFQLDMFASIIRDTASSAVGGTPVNVTNVGDKQGFHGIYANFNDIHPYDSWCWMDSSGKILPFLGRHEVDAYAFYSDLSDGAFVGEDGKTGNVDELTLGLRGAGEFLRNSYGAGFDYSAEFAYQMGRFVEDDIQAYGFAVTAGYTIAAKPMDGVKVRLGAEYDYGSGDSNPADGRHETFDPLFPYAHKYQGMQDIFSWKNGQDLAFQATAFLPKKWRVTSLELAFHLFWLSEEKDAWYNAALQPIRRDTTGAAGRFVGSEVDVSFRYDLIPEYATMWVGYSHFFPGQYVEDTGGSPDRDFVFAQLQVDF